MVRSTMHTVDNMLLRLQGLVIVNRKLDLVCGVSNFTPNQELPPIIELGRSNTPFTSADHAGMQLDLVPSV